jgi:hypothetical protein
MPDSVFSRAIATASTSDCCALSLQPFQNPVAVISEPSEANPTARADVFELMNIVPYIRKYKTNPVTGAPLDTSQLIKLNFFKVRASLGCGDDPCGWLMGREDRTRRATITIRSRTRCFRRMSTLYSYGIR